jgi:NADPH-dependent ferric siderophore reductase
VGVVVAGSDLDGLTIDLPAASVRLLLPSPRADELVIPVWNGNEFLLPDGRRPTIRTMTPRRIHPDTGELDLENVLHGHGHGHGHGPGDGPGPGDGHGPAAAWAAAAKPGDPAAISGPGRGYTIDRDAPAFLLAGDETAIPAISQLLEALPAATPVQVHIEIARPDARLALPEHPRATIGWRELPPEATTGDALVAAIRGADIDPGAHVWVAGEAAAVQRIRRHLFEERGLPRSQATIRGYWKHGRSGDTDSQA